MATYRKYPPVGNAISRYFNLLTPSPSTIIGGSVHETNTAVASSYGSTSVTDAFHECLLMELLASSRSQETYSKNVAHKQALTQGLPMELQPLQQG